MVWMQNFNFSHKLVAMVWCPLFTKGQGALDHEGGKLVGKKFMVGQFLKNWLKKTMKLAPWMEEGVWNFLTQIGSCGVVWIPSIANVLPLLGGNNHGGYCVLCKVQTKRFNRIPSTIELVTKTSKTDDK